MNWQPMNTAPKDGTTILAYDFPEITVVEFSLTRKTWIISVCGSYAEDDIFYPTQWMPLPEPPSHE